MPRKGDMAYYPAFPPAIRLSGVGCIRVAHPCATLRSPEGPHPVRLACIRPAASVHPEPGSNSSLYYCLFSFFSGIAVPLTTLRFLYRHTPVCPQVPSPASPSPHGAFSGACPLVLASSYQRTLRNLSPRPAPLPLIAGCKNTTFSITGNAFFHVFFEIYTIPCVSMRKIFKEINNKTKIAAKSEDLATIYNKVQSQQPYNLRATSFSV